MATISSMYSSNLLHHPTTKPLTAQSQPSKLTIQLKPFTSSRIFYKFTASRLVLNPRESTTVVSAVAEVASPVRSHHRWRQGDCTLGTFRGMLGTMNLLESSKNTAPSRKPRLCMTSTLEGVADLHLLR